MTPEERALKAVPDYCRVEDHAAMLEHRKFVANAITVAVLEAQAETVERCLQEFAHWYDRPAKTETIVQLFNRIRSHPQTP